MNTITKLESLATRWEKDAVQYSKLVDEARRAGTPHDQMLAMMTALRGCASDLRKAMTQMGKNTTAHDALDTTQPA